MLKADLHGLHGLAGVCQLRAAGIPAVRVKVVAA